MTTQDQYLNMLDQQIKDAQVTLEMGKALARLRDNPDFKKLVVKGYLENEAVRLVHLKADPSMQSVPDQAGIDRDINSIGSLAQYFRAVEMMGARAESSIAEAEAAREEIQQEGE